MELWNWLVGPAGLTPHGFCLLWSPGLIWLHVAADALIGLSYFSIPLALGAFVSQRKDLRYHWVGYLFVAFILACGLTHFLSILTLWVPAYGVEGVVKVITALLSVATAAILWPLIPRLVALPSPESLRQVNEELSARVAEHEKTLVLLRESEGRARAAGLELEQRVIERTADLTAAKADLEKVVEERTDALRQRDLLLREVYHRVKNNLQVIDGLVVMQARQVEDPEARQAVLGLRSRIHALGLVHQQLMTSADLQTFDIAQFLRELSDNILQSGAGGQVELTVDAVPLAVTLDTAIPVGLLVTELATNSMKHAFPDGKGRISISLSRARDGETLLSVSDNGIGDRGPAPGGAADGVRAAGRDGLGLRIVEGLVRQLQGRMTVRREPGFTTEIHLTLPEVAA